MNDYAYVETSSNTWLIIVIALLIGMSFLCGIHLRFSRFLKQVSKVNRIVQGRSPSVGWIEHLEINASDSSMKFMKFAVFSSCVLVVVLFLLTSFKIWLLITFCFFIFFPISYYIFFLPLSFYAKRAINLTKKEEPMLWEVPEESVKFGNNLSKGSLNDMSAFVNLVVLCEFLKKGLKLNNIVSMMKTNNWTSSTTSCPIYLGDTQIARLRDEYDIEIASCKGIGVIEDPIVVNDLVSNYERKTFVIQYIKWLNIASFLLWKVSSDDFFSKLVEDVLSVNYQIYRFKNDKLITESRKVYFKFI